MEHRSTPIRAGAASELASGEEQPGFGHQATRSTRSAVENMAGRCRPAPNLRHPAARNSAIYGGAGICSGRTDRQPTAQTGSVLPRTEWGGGAPSSSSTIASSRTGRVVQLGPALGPHLDLQSGLASTPSLPPHASGPRTAALLGDDIAHGVCTTADRQSTPGSSRGRLLTGITSWVLARITFSIVGSCNLKTGYDAI